MFVGNEGGVGGETGDMSLTVSGFIQIPKQKSLCMSSSKLTERVKPKRGHFEKVL